MSQQIAVSPAPMPLVPAAHSPLPPFSAWSGPRRPRLLLVGEAFGESEDKLRKPFCGEAGKELFRQLGEALPLVDPSLHSEICALHRYDLAWVGRRDDWFESAGIAMTNVLNFRPQGNKLDQLCVAKGELEDAKAYPMPALVRGKYLPERFLPELSRLAEEIDQAKPNVIVALGNTACWALLHVTNIGSIRGNVTQSQMGPKCLPTSHPAGVLRQWSWRPIVIADLMKAGREAAYPEIRRPQRGVLINPTIGEVEEWTRQTLAHPPARLGGDCETTHGQISCISFARSRADAIVIPFIRKDLSSYWTDEMHERRAWMCVQQLMESNIPKLFQNGLYDYQYIFPLGIKLVNCQDDTMLLHHSLFPEMQKGLGFLGSVYTNEQSWKLLRRRRPDTEKKDE